MIERLRHVAVGLLPSVLGLPPERCFDLVEAGVFTTHEVSRQGLPKGTVRIVSAKKLRTVDREIVVDEAERDAGTDLSRSIFAATGRYVRQRLDPRTAGFAGLDLEVAAALDLWPTSEPVLFLVEGDLSVSKALRGVLRRPDARRDDLPSDAVAHLSESVVRKGAEAEAAVRSAVDLCRARLADDYADPAELQALVRLVTADAMNRFAVRVSDFSADAVVAAVGEWFDGCLARIEGQRRHLRAKVDFSAPSGYDRYPSLFPLARSMGRRILYLAGPTNSGKTHEALALAAGADAAEVLSPLRLLAQEHQEALVRLGRRAGLVTGEERRLEHDTTHVARTIETADMGRAVDVAVIDEIQLLGDPDRGWAWTQALVGVPASLVVLTGPPTAIPVVERMAALLGEELEVRRFERKNALATLGSPVAFKDLRPGDALIAFSRRDVYQLREEVAGRGLRVATIYGALGPEVRRAEARRFREGDADVVVATDAIGMGLNLPIRRVVFSTLTKFDGRSDRGLRPPEVQQIAGRAGRHGMYAAGEVGVLGGRGSADRLRNLVEAAVPPLEGKAYVRPNADSVALAARHLGTDELARILVFLRDRLVGDGNPDFRIAEMQEAILKAHDLDPIGLPLLDRYAYSLAPVSYDQPWQMRLLTGWARRHASHGLVDPPNFSSYEMHRIETDAKMATAWLWLSQRYPDVYPEDDAVRDMLLEMNAEIERELVGSSGKRARKWELARTG